MFPLHASCSWNTIIRVFYNSYYSIYQRNFNSQVSDSTKQQICECNLFFMEKLAHTNPVFYTIFCYFINSSWLFFLKCAFASIAQGNTICKEFIFFKNWKTTRWNYITIFLKKREKYNVDVKIYRRVWINEVFIVVFVMLLLPYGAYGQIGFDYKNGKIYIRKDNHFYCALVSNRFVCEIFSRFYFNMQLFLTSPLLKWWKESNLLLTI